MALQVSGCGPTHTPQASGASGTNHTQYTRSIARASTGPEAEDVSWAAWRAVPASREVALRPPVSVDAVAAACAAAAFGEPSEQVLDGPVEQLLCV